MAAVHADRDRGARALARPRPARRGRPRRRVRGRSTPDGTVARGPRPAHGRGDRWRGSVLRGHDEPVASRPATASRWRCARVSRSPTSSSCSSTRRRCTTRACRGRCSRRRCGARARSSATTQGVAFMADEHPLGRPRAARRRRARDHAPAQRPRPRPPVARRDADRRTSPRRFPTVWRVVPVGRPRPDARLAAGRPGRALPLGRHRAPTSTARQRFPGSGRAVRPRAAASTAPTGSRRTRCSTASCSGRGSIRAIAAGKDGPDATGVLRGVDVPRPRRRRSVTADGGGRRPAWRGSDVARGPAAAHDARRGCAARSRAASSTRSQRSRAMDPVDVEVANLVDGEHRVGSARHWRERNRAERTRASTSPSARPRSPAAWCSPAGPEPVFVPLPEPAVTR